jgi:hypothetical protein
MLWYWDPNDNSDDPPTVDDVIIDNPREPYNDEPFWPDPGNILPWDQLFVNEDLVCVLQTSENPSNDLYGWLYDRFNQIYEDTFGHPPGWVLSARDEASTFTPTGKIRESPYSDKWYDPKTDSFWIDLNDNGTPETNFIFDGSDVWVDTNFDGNFEHRVDNPNY